MILNLLYHFASDVLMFVSMGAYFARISDESIGGTYLTLLNTLQNLGGTWPKLLALLFVDRLTWKQCKSQTEVANVVVCNTWVDGMFLLGIMLFCCSYWEGFYLCSFLCLVVGAFLAPWIERRIRYLESLSPESFALDES